MSAQKVWVISDSDTGSPESPPMPEPRATGRTTTATEAARPPRLNPAMARRSRAIIALTYLLGPAGILVPASGRRSPFWLAIGVGSVLSAALLWWRWPDMARVMERGPAAFLIGCATIGLVALAGFSAWARAVHLVGRGRSLSAPVFGGWIMRPAACGLLSLLVPGLGFLVAGRVKRAAVTLWLMAPPVVAALILTRAPDLWRASRVPTGGAGDLAIEQVLILAAGVAGLGVLIWIVQALDAVRVAGFRFGFGARLRGDVYPAALLIVILLFAVLFDTGSTASTLDRYASRFRQAGLRLVPLHLERTALRLDPSRPLYAVRVIELCDELGREDAARHLRESLARRWIPYIDMLRREGALGDLVGARPQPPAPPSGGGTTTPAWNPGMADL